MDYYFKSESYFAYSASKSKSSTGKLFVMFTIRPAISQDASTLTQIAVISKAHWGYSDGFMQAAQAELSVTAAYINADDRYYACAENSQTQILGYAGLTQITSSVVELDALFIRPSEMGNGIGKALFQHACSKAKMMGADRMTIQSDPNALLFYQRMQCKEVGTRESGSIPGRFLPLLEFAL